MLPAARKTDWHLCPAHGGGPVNPEGRRTVEVNGLAQAHACDKAVCQGPSDVLVTGSGTVTINSKPAARLTDKSMHGGSVLVGSSNVLIGGPTVGATLGNLDAAQAACVQSAKGRDGNSPRQHYGNCGVESARQIINQATGKNVREDEAMREAIQHGEVSDKEKWDKDTGGTSPPGRTSILDRNGVPSHREWQNEENIQQAIADGKGVITSHDAGMLWNDPRYNGVGHAIVVTGLQYGPDGKLQEVIVNDSGDGSCGKHVPAKQFFGSVRPYQGANVTDKPIW